MTDTLRFPDDAPRFSRAWWLSVGRNLLWVSLITIVIWIYADLEKTESRDLGVKIRLVTGRSDELALAGGTVEADCRFTVRGSNTAVDRYSRELAEQGWVIPYDLSEKGVLGDNTIQAAGVLDDLTGVSKAGLVIASVAPPFLKVTLIRPQAEFRAELVLTTGNAKELAFLNSDDIFRRKIEGLAFKVEGSRSALAGLQKSLTDSNSQIQYNLAGAYGPGKHVLQLAEILRAAELLAKPGLKALSARAGEANAVTVELDQALLVPNVEVKLVSSGATVGESRIEPPRMGLYAPKSRWEELLKTQPKPVLETVSVPLQAGASDTPQTVQINPLVGGVAVRPDAATVQVTVKISQLTGEKTLTIPVRLLVPQSWAEDDTWDRYVLKRKDPTDWRKKITFQGPKKDVEKLQAEDVDAYVTLTDNDKIPTTSWLTRDVEFRLPRDLQLQVVGEKPCVSFRLDPRAAQP